MKFPFNVLIFRVMHPCDAPSLLPPIPVKDTLDGSSLTPSGLTACEVTKLTCEPLSHNAFIVVARCPLEILICAVPSTILFDDMMLCTSSI